MKNAHDFSRDLTIDGRIKAEEERLLKIYKDIPKNARNLIIGLIERASFLRVTLSDYEKDIHQNGATEMYCQSKEKQIEFERKKPITQLYNQMTKNYAAIIKQLTDLLPKGESKLKDDSLLKFIKK
ncbi:hypothetical protein ACSU64_20975 [Bacillaceae bacterium C204]|uniref:hypothetical protein n=1 Tax=Neobacillus sp. 204 TaxID=3383351 RepID=UPI00397E5D55